MLSIFSSVQSLSRVQFFATPWTTARQASLSITNSRSSPKPMSIVSVIPSNHLILCRPLLLLPSIFPSIRVVSNESVLRIRWLKYWSFRFGISPTSEYSGLISFRMDWFDLANKLNPRWGGVVLETLSFSQSVRSTGNKPLGIDIWTGDELGQACGTEPCGIWYYFQVDSVRIELNWRRKWQRTPVFLPGES